MSRTSSHNRIVCFSSIIAASLAATGLHAQTLDDELTEEDFLQGLPQVMSATRLPQSVADTPASITVLDRQLIDASGFTEIGDLFRLVPGFQVGLSWRDHHTATTYHGQTDGLSRRMQVLVDGRTAFTSQFGLTDWDRLGISVQDIERIEVVRGPVGSAYGSNAFVAAINIVTRDPALSPNMEVFATLGSADTQIGGARYRHIGERLEYTASANYLGSDGFDRGNSDVSVFSARLQGRYQLSGNQGLDFQLGHAGGPSGRGGNGTLPDPVGHKDVTEQHIALRFNDALSPENEWYIQVSYDRSRREDSNDIGTVRDVLTATGSATPEDQLEAFELLTGVSFDPGFLDQSTTAGPYDYHANRLDVELQQILSFSGHSRLVWGAGYRQNRIKGGLVLNSYDRIAEYGTRLYGNWEYRTGDWLFNLGAMYENESIATGELSSRIGVNYRLSDNHSLRASFARGWRHPFIGEANHQLALKSESGFTVERFIEVPGTLTPERMTTWELGYVGGWFNGAMKTELKLYRENIGNEIQEVLVPCFVDPSACELSDLFARGSGQPNGVIYRINGGDTEIEGLEGNLNYDFGQGSRLWMSYAYADADQVLPVGALRGIYGYNGTPRHTASALLSHGFDTGWEVSAGYYYLDEMAWFFFGGDTDSYDRIDLRLARDFTIGGSHCRMELIGQNLMGGSYSEFTPANQFNTRGFLRFTLQLN